jgi:hypothetical protein
VIGIRKVISGTDEPPIAEIVNNSNILEILGSIFRFTDTSEEIRIMKLEAIWILTNLAYGSINEL